MKRRSVQQQMKASIDCGFRERSDSRFCGEVVPTSRREILDSHSSPNVVTGSSRLSRRAGTCKRHESRFKERFAKMMIMVGEIVLHFHYQGEPCPSPHIWSPKKQALDFGSQRVPCIVHPLETTVKICWIRGIQSGGTYPVTTLLSGRMVTKKEAFVVNRMVRKKTKLFVNDKLSARLLEQE